MKVQVEFEGDSFPSLWHAGVNALDVAIRAALAGEGAGGQDDGSSDPSRKAHDDPDTRKPPAATSPRDPRGAGGGPT